jgi:hypothetical protein
VLVRGRISEDGTDGDTDTIHANSVFYIRDRTWGGWLGPGASRVFGGLTAHVG